MLDRRLRKLSTHLGYLDLYLVQAAAQHEQLEQPHAVAETLTPTKLFYSNNVAKAQKVFAEGFTRKAYEIKLKMIRRG